MRLSLRHKTAILFICITAVLSGCIIFAANNHLRKAIDQEYQTRASDVAHTAAAIVDEKHAETVISAVQEILAGIEEPVLSDDWGSDAFNDYLKNYSSVTNMPEYQMLLGSLRRIQNVNDVDCIYIVYIMPDKTQWVYVVDAAEENPCMPGVIDSIDEQDFKVIRQSEFQSTSFITDSPEYGWLVTASAPIYRTGDKSTVIGFACVDISMNAIQAVQKQVTGRLFLIVLVLAALIAVLSIWIVNRSIIDPLNKLTNASKQFSSINSLESHCFENLGIKTGDEIETLADSMEQMEQSLNQQIRNLVQVSDELNQTQKLVIKDGLTGIRNKLGYAQEVQRLEEELAQGSTKFGIVMIDMNYLKRINDEYGHEKGDIALKLTSGLICNVFVHSPVFRYGGDEFVVVLRDNDYEKIEELKQQFEAKIEELSQNEDLPPWERISASLGYALYDGTVDRDAEDVFRRADKAMYDRKVEMKTLRVDEQA